MSAVEPTVPLFRRGALKDTFYFLFFLIHIPITILIDSALVIGPEYRFRLQNALISFHITTNKDFLLEDPPTALTVFGWIEILFQLPFFFFAVYYLYKRNTKIELYMAIYALEASLTTMFCLCYVFIIGPEYGLEFFEILNLVLIYAPTFLIPFSMMIDISGRYDKKFEEYQEKEINQLKKGK